MKDYQLGMLEKIDLRNIWNHEALDFTNWLARPENLKLLSDEVGIEINLITTEARVHDSDFHVDILAEELNTGKKIIIENQLEETNHNHLGKLITYASGLEAEIIIWIVKNVREEHRQAIDWLNEHSDGKIKFFVIRMELWKIGDSLPAPKFYIISNPNDWAKEVRESVEDSEMSETKLLQLEFWKKFKEYAEANHTLLRFKSPRPQHWYTVAIGSSKAYISFTVDTREGLVSCAIYIPHFKDLFMDLELKKEEIEEKLGTTLEWMKLEEKKASRIRLSSHIDITQKVTWKSAFEWLQIWGEKFQKVFGEYIKTLDTY